ncbi:MAG: phosphoribosylformylglycinamidine synthase subunit PurS [Elusimicrobia bacterium]|nr:phosphoribosylformylglycinamidine synthase subunit PurS [Elusimicrobiota bacterium]
MSDKTAVLAKETPETAAVKTAAAGPGSYLVEVCLKSDFTDAEGQSAQWLLNSAGLSARAVRVGRLYEMRGALNLGHVHVAVRELLCDCVTQEFRVWHASCAAPGNGCLWRVEVWLKPTVTDTVGESVRDALRDLGIPDIAVRCGLAYHIAGRCSRQQLDRAVARSLANPIVHRVSLHEAS